MRCARTRAASHGRTPPRRLSPDCFRYSESLHHLCPIESSMPATETFTIKRLWPVIAVAAIVIVTALLLHLEGRLWICACGRVLLWSGNVCSSDNSQHLFDPYSFTHLMHGFAFCG